MAADPTAAERAYAAIKAKLFAGAFHLRQRLDATAIAGEVGVSTTPVREALVRLTTERLVVSRPPHGYHMVLWSEVQLRTLYEWRCWLAVRASEMIAAPIATATSRAGGFCDRVSETLNELNVNAGSETQYAAASADDRLYRARSAEFALWDDAEEELEELARGLRNNEHGDRAAALRKYHARRIDAVRDIRERAVLLLQPANGG
jgi:DNA-binding GntR family transcriptional regulator